MVDLNTPLFHRDRPLLAVGHADLLMGDDLLVAEERADVVVHLRELHLAGVVLSDLQPLKLVQRDVHFVQVDGHALTSCFRLVYTLRGERLHVFSRHMQGRQAFLTILTPETVRRLVEKAMPIKVIGLPEGRKRSV